MKRIVAIDFDGTIVLHDFPKIGRLIPGAKETILCLKDMGHQVFLWTMRGTDSNLPGGNTLTPVCEFLNENRIPIDGFNHSLEQMNNSPKQYANIYIDDMALGCPKVVYIDKQTGKTTVAADWRAIARHLAQMGYISWDHVTGIETSINCGLEQTAAGAFIIK